MILVFARPLFECLFLEIVSAKKVSEIYSFKKLAGMFSVFLLYREFFGKSFKKMETHKNHKFFGSSLTSNEKHIIKLHQVLRIFRSCNFFLPIRTERNF